MLSGGCQGQGADRPAQSRGSAVAGSASAAPAAPSRGDHGPPHTGPDQAGVFPLSQVTQLLRQGALPVWEGVVQRAQFLARRGQRATLIGRVGPPVGEGALVWLVDDTEGGGALAIRAAFPGAPPPAGARVAAQGAWILRAAPTPAPSTDAGAASGLAGATAAPQQPAAAVVAPPRWVWQVESSIGLAESSGEATPAPAAALTTAEAGDSSDPGAEPVVPAAAPAGVEPSAIGHEPVSRPRPPGAVPISKAKDNDLVVFVVLAAPRSLGEGWVVGDELGSPVAAILQLPGDRPSYGGIDFRQPDEVWRLRRGVSYFVRIGKVRRKDPAKPAQINARNAPVKVS